MGKLTEAFKKAERENRRPAGDGSHRTPATDNISSLTVNTPPLEPSLKAGVTNKTSIKKEGAGLQSPINPKVIVFYQPESLAAEHFKVLRASIFHPRDGRKIKSIMITSAMEQEGKTFVAANLAVSIAQSVNPHVLVIDSDCRRPNFHNMVGMENRQGLTEYLQEQDRPLSDFLAKASIPKLTVLTAGQPVRNPSELMTSDRMSALLKETRERYEDRFVLVDSPPALLAAETITLSKFVDAVILVIRYGKAEREAVEEAINRIGKEKIFGTIFNGFEIAPRRQGYYRKYGYGYGYGYGSKKKRSSEEKDQMD